jgi:hypothetical protein
MPSPLWKEGAMSDTPESNKAKIAFTSLFANDDAYWVPFKVSCKLERERDEFRGLLIELYNDINVIHSGKAVSKLNKLFRDENYN